ncbi:MAG: tetratricopeptide repeat protein, partial [Actinomycetia bacterium]|nr:tetratricopeptide repeat protein [Actinomycetes bacterium]
MNQDSFAQGMRQYRAGNYAQAAQDFLESAEPGIARGNGSAFHQAGNAFLQLKRNKDALTMYQNALRDDTYDNMSAVYSNIGLVHAKEGNYAASADAYELASTYPECEKPYKCHLKVAQNQMKLGSIDKAAIAYKKAALDLNNPQRSKALYNLALCLLELKQPLSAVESLKLALEFPDCENRGQVFSSLGIAYSLLNSDEEAVEAFEHASYSLGEEGLSPVAASAYAAARARLAALAPEPPIIEETVIDDSDEEALSRTGEIQSIDMGQTDAADVYPAVGTDEEIAHFFALTDDELAEQGKQIAMAEHHVLWWKVALWSLLGLLLVAALAVGLAYFFGLGYPPANEIVYNALSAYGSEQNVAPYWNVDQSQAELQMQESIPRQAVFDIGPPSGRMNESKVTVHVTDMQDVVTTLTFTLVRDGLSWKISSVSADHPVQGESITTTGQTQETTGTPTEQVLPAATTDQTKTGAPDDGTLANEQYEE